MASPSAGAPAHKYGDVNIVTPSPGEVKGLMESIIFDNNSLSKSFLIQIFFLFNFFDFSSFCKSRIKSLYFKNLSSLNNLAYKFEIL